MKIKYKLLLSIIVISLGICLMMYQSYALWIAQKRGDTSSLQSGCFNIEFEELSSSISLHNSYPISDTKGLSQTPYKFTIKNTCSVTGNYQVTLNTLTTNTMTIDKIKYAISENTPTQGLNLGLQAIGNTNNDVENIPVDNLDKSIVIASGTLNADEKVTYNFYLWIDETAGNEVMGARFEASINVISAPTMLQEINNTEIVAMEKIKDIRSTPNTDISTRTGKVYYVSSNGNDSNDGLSEKTAWKTLTKINESFEDGTIQDGDTILLKRGDIFRGNIIISRNDILIGSYGDETKEKPALYGSLYDGAKEGEWIEVFKNIWKYTVNGGNPFTEDVGSIWFFCNEGNKNCSQKMSFLNETFEYGQKITTTNDYDESNIEEKISTLLSNDLEFYHAGHDYSYDTVSTGKELYIYSVGNPKERFDSIEFNAGINEIRLKNSTNLHVDNLKIKFAGNHGISAGSVANLKVTNCEFGFIGGSVQNYNNGYVRYGNAIQIWGEVAEENGFDVEEGFIAQNNYIYQVYDAGLTFQYTSENTSRMEKTTFENNVVEYCNYNVEYWVDTNSENEEDINNTYINNFYIRNNIFRHAGEGVSQTRPNKGQSAHIKTWSSHLNYLKGEFIIENNIFDTSSEQTLWIYAANEESLPQLINNTFYNSRNVPFGYLYYEEQIQIPYIKESLEKQFPTNAFKYID